MADLQSWSSKDCCVRNRRLVESGEKATKVDLGFFRRVKLVQGSIPRAGYADAKLTSRMKVRQTNVDITDIRCSVLEAICRHRRQQPIDFGQVIKERCANDVLDVIKEKLNPDAFERLIADYFERQGASVRIPPKNERDKQGDADVEATFPHLRLIIYVQAKHHEGETNEWAVEQIEKYVEHRKLSEHDRHYDHVAWVVSTATFSEDCRRRVESERAESAGAIQLVEGQEFAKMLLDVGIEAVGRLR